MRVVPARPAWAQIGTVFGSFLVGPYLGLQTALLLTPGLDVVQTVSVFAFGLVVGGGVGVLAGLVSDLSVWMGAGVWALVGLAYGYALQTAAHHGCLPFPEPE